MVNSTEEKGLGNPGFIKDFQEKKHLARVWSINEDNGGKLWIGTIDAGAWRYHAGRAWLITPQRMGYR